MQFLPNYALFINILVDHLSKYIKFGETRIFITENYVLKN